MEFPWNQPSSEFGVATFMETSISCLLQRHDVKAIPKHPQTADLHRELHHGAFHGPMADRWSFGFRKAVAIRLPVCFCMFLLHNQHQWTSININKLQRLSVLWTMELATGAFDSKPVHLHTLWFQPNWQLICNAGHTSARPSWHY